MNSNNFPFLKIMTDKQDFCLFLDMLRVISLWFINRNKDKRRTLKMWS